VFASIPPSKASCNYRRHAIAGKKYVREKTGEGLKGSAEYDKYNKIYDNSNFLGGTNILLVANPPSVG